MATDPAKWVRLNVPPQFRMGPERMAEVCAWRTRREGEELLVCIEERHLSSRPKLIRPVRLADSTNASSAVAYRTLEFWPAQDEFRGQWAGAADAEAGKRLSSQEFQEWLYGWQLLLLTAPDADVPRLVRESFAGTILANFPSASA